MEIKNELGQDGSVNVVEKKYWVSPEIEVHDIVEMTQSGDYSEKPPFDLESNYS
jgi:hypothetical protein